tara:strand:+ start:85 stop:939 length:855 start_codon:yes stop_codon:yes gene_type:complete
VADKQTISRNGVGSVSGVMKKIGHLMKYLIVSGDSNTTADFDSISHPDMDFSYKKWPELLAEKLGMKVINVARSGQGNEFIYTTMRNEIVKIEDKSQIGLVIAAWSQAPRRDYKQEENPFRQPWSSIRIDTHGNLPYWVQRSLGYYLDFQILCERYNIPYVQFQMIELFEHYLEGIKPSQTEVHFGADPKAQATYPGNKTKHYSSILKSIMDYENILDTSKFMGWPPVKKLGGWRFKDQLDFFDNSKSKLRVSESDNHPNGLGHIAMCDKINILLKEYNIIEKK